MAAEVELTTFKALGLDPWLARQCNVMGMRVPTSVQKNCIPPILQGRDCVGCAKTGSGKTAAFALPIIQKWSEDKYGIFAVVLTPTRELAVQIAEQFRAFGKSVGLRDALVVGGLDYIKQASQLSQQPHVVIATPGRLADLIRTSDTFHFKHLKYLVLDEADRLLEDSFASDLKDILQVFPKQRQTLLFSATLTEAMESLKTMQKPNCFHFQIDAKSATVEELDQRYTLIPSQVKDPYIVYILQQQSEKKSTIIFTGTCRSCHVLTYLLQRCDLPAVALHSLLPQNRRLASLAKFRAGIVKILVSTDVASRGLDIPEVDLVLNTNVPASPIDYIHRVGRTARAGRGGRAITLVTQYDVQRIKAIEEHIGVTLEEEIVPEEQALRLLKPVSIIKREVEIRVNDSSFGQNRKTNRKKQQLIDQMQKTAAKPTAKKHKKKKGT